MIGSKKVANGWIIPGGVVAVTKGSKMIRGPGFGPLSHSPTKVTTRKEENLCWGTSISTQITNKKYNPKIIQTIKKGF